MGARTDLLGITFITGEKAAAPKGLHLGQIQEVAANQVLDADRTLAILEDYVPAGANLTTISGLRTTLA